MLNDYEVFKMLFVAGLSVFEISDFQPQRFQNEIIGDLLLDPLPNNGFVLLNSSVELFLLLLPADDFKLLLVDLVLKLFDVAHFAFQHVGDLDQVLSLDAQLVVQLLDLVIELSDFFVLHFHARIEQVHVFPIGL